MSCVESIEKLIDSAIVKRVESKESRDYMGMSGIGEECSLKLWYSYHQPKKILDPRVNRIFDFGHLLEEYVVRLLRDAGFTIYDKDENGEEFRISEGLLGGGIDGVISGLPGSTENHLLEIKSASDKRFKEFAKKGYKSDKKYWTQIHTYMLKFGLKKCLVVIINKNDSSLYMEIVDLDSKYADRQILRAHEISKLTEENKPVRQYGKSTFYKCRFCDWNSECWAGEER